MRVTVMKWEGGRPEFAALYGARETPTAAYPNRTRRNPRDSQATLRFGDTGSSGARTTLDACRNLGRPSLIVAAGELIRPSQVADWIATGGIEILNVACNRESNAPSIGGNVERFLIATFRQLGHRPG